MHTEELLKQFFPDSHKVFEEYNIEIDTNEGEAEAFVAEVF